MLPSLKKTSSYIGMGVAARMPDHSIRKLKIVSLEMTVDSFGRRITMVHALASSGSIVGFKPELCFRSKGECARYYAGLRMNELSSRIKDAESRIGRQRDDLERMERSLSEDREKLRRHMESVEKSKWKSRPVSG